MPLRSTEHAEILEFLKTVTAEVPICKQQSGTVEDNNVPFRGAEFPGFPEGGDLSYWAKGDHAKEKLISAVESIAPSEAPQTKPNLIGTDTKRLDVRDRTNRMGRRANPPNRLGNAALWCTECREDLACARYRQSYLAGKSILRQADGVTQSHLLRP